MTWLAPGTRGIRGGVFLVGFDDTDVEGDGAGDGAGDGDGDGAGDGDGEGACDETVMNNN